MTLAPWRSVLAGALHRHRSLPNARYIQLATVRTDGHPANRTVVFRGFLEDTNSLKFVTDGRSDKVEQIDQHPWGEVCWYFPNTREQFRLFGSLTLVGAESEELSLSQARTATWQQLSEAARSQFSWPHPGEPRTEPFPETSPDPEVPVPHFQLLLLHPEQVDHLELRGEPQNRWLYQLSSADQWSVAAINP